MQEVGNLSQGFWNGLLFFACNRLGQERADSQAAADSVRGPWSVDAPKGGEDLEAPMLPPGAGNEDEERAGSDDTEKCRLEVPD